MQMNKPYLIIVTGRPGAGKTTFAKILGDEIHLPIISRDKIKEGYLQTLGKSHKELPLEINQIATDIFFETLENLIKNKVSVIAEAAFQHQLWSSKLLPFFEKVQIKLLICKVDEHLALERYIKRGLDNEFREYFHGDAGIDLARKREPLYVSPYEEPQLDVPTYYIDTTSEYKPSIEELKNILLK